MLSKAMHKHFVTFIKRAPQRNEMKMAGFLLRSKTDLCVNVIAGDVDQNEKNENTKKIGALHTKHTWITAFCEIVKHVKTPSGSRHGSSHGLGFFLTVRLCRSLCTSKLLALLCLVFTLVYSTVCACVKTEVPIGSIFRSYLSVDDEL